MNIPARREGEASYVKALPLKHPSDVKKIASEVEKGNILIIKITPLARKSVEETKEAINHLKGYIEEKGGDIARLGEERIVVTPSPIKIWRKK